MGLDCEHGGAPGSFDYCNPECPCDIAEGDCDDNDECNPGLTCVKNVGADFGWDPDVDVCLDTCHPAANGTFDYCSPECPCGLAEGDCDDNDECDPGLTCVKNVGADFGWDPDVDVCLDTCHPAANGTFDYCSPECPCDIAEGDCDSDSECLPGLACVKNIGADYGWDPDVDVCLGPACNPVLWNTLGSDMEVLDSAIGPNLTFYSSGGGLEVVGDSAYVAGVFGNAVTLGGGPYGIYDRIHNIVLDNLPAYIDPERGTIETWYMQTTDPLGYSHGVYRIFDGSYGLGSGMGLESIDLLNGSKVLSASLSFGGPDAVSVSTNISAYNNTWIHIAAVWDRNGIDGTTDALRLYVNGAVAVATTANNWGTTVGPRADIVGGNDHNILNKFFVDNLVIWDFAQTDFAHRFGEDPCAN